jgi:hypothetical protein
MSPGRPEYTEDVEESNGANTRGSARDVSARFRRQADDGILDGKMYVLSARTLAIVFGHQCFREI